MVAMRSEPEPTKHCSQCDQWRPATRYQFPQDDRRPGGFHAICRTCQNGRMQRTRDYGTSAGLWKLTRGEAYEAVLRRAPSDWVDRMTVVQDRYEAYDRENPLPTLTIISGGVETQYRRGAA